MPAITTRCLPPFQRYQKTNKPLLVEIQPALLSYVKGVTDRVGNILRKASVKTIYKSYKKVNQFLTPVKSNIHLQRVDLYKLDIATLCIK